MVVRISQDGKYLRVYYRLKGKKRGSFIPLGDDPEQAWKAARAEKRRLEKRLQAYGTEGVFSREVLRDIQAARVLLADVGASLEDAARFYLAVKPAKAGGATWAEAVEAFLESKEHKDGETLRWYRSKLGRTLPGFGHIGLDAMPVKEVLAWIRSMGNSATTDRGYLKCFTAVYRYAMRADIGLASANPFEHMGERLARPLGRIGDILTPEQGQAFLQAVADPWKGAFALRYFTGLRVVTLAKTDWRQVDRARRMISIDAAADKMRRERFITAVPVALWDWLERYGGESGPVVGSKFSFNRAQAAALRALEGRGQSFPWPRGALRRSFASYGLHVLGLTDTLLTMCHTEDGQTFWRKYFHRATREEAERYFDVWPE